jgi:hypothetical protein
MLFLENWRSQVKDDHTNIVQPDMVQYIYLNTLFTHTHSGPIRAQSSREFFEILVEQG